MKTVIPFLLCILFSISCFGQNNLSKELTRENYLHKSKVKKKTGYILLGTGVALFITGGIIDQVKKPELLAGFTYEFLGVVSALASIPFFTSASNNKRKAMLITLNIQNTLPFHQDVALKSIQPTVTYQIRF